MPPFFPELFCCMGGKWRNYDEKLLNRFPVNFCVAAFLIVLNRACKLHYLPYCKAQPEVINHFSYLFYCGMQLALEIFLLVREFLHCTFRHILCKAVNSIEKPEAAVDAPVRPLQFLLRMSCKQNEKPCRICAVRVDDFLRVHNIAK